MINLNIKGTQIFQKSRGHLKIIGARRTTKFHTEDPLSGAITQSSVAWANRCPRFVHPCSDKHHLPCPSGYLHLTKIDREFQKSPHVQKKLP